MIVPKQYFEDVKVNQETKLKIPYNFDYASGFKNNLAIVKTGGLFGIIDKKGTYVIKPEFEEMKYFYNNTLLVKQDDLMGIIDLKGQILLPINYTKVEFTDNQKMLKLHTDAGLGYKRVEEVFK